MLYALTIFVSAFLLFLVQPLIGKQILPWFGGTASVWTVCLVFFQLVLLAGYTYADRLSRLAVRTQAVVHTVLVLAACALLPVIPNTGWKPTDFADPTWRILLLLAATIGLPYLAVCTTGPLVQSWFARVHAGDGVRQARVYRLFALSNFASLLALVAYPFAMEPFATLRAQSWTWSAGFLVFAALVIAAAWTTERRLRTGAAPAGALPKPSLSPAASDIRAADAGAQTGIETNSEMAATTRADADINAARPAAHGATSPNGVAPLPADVSGAATPHVPTPTLAGPPRWSDYGLWLLLAALGTVMLLTVTTHITQDVASVPFLWILPLALYLLTFILCFDSAFWYRRWLFWPAVIVLAPAMAWGLSASHGVLAIERAIPLFSGGMFAICMFCHGELVRAKPAPAYLTRFYLMISVGGALGGLLVGVVAPRVFSGYWELPVALVAAGLLLWYVARVHIQTGLVLFSVALLAGFAWFAKAYVYLPTDAVVVIMLILGAIVVFLVSFRSRSWGAAAGLLGGLAAALCVYLGIAYGDFIKDDTIAGSRNFYGALRIKQYGETGADGSMRRLMHGVISHGEQLLEPRMTKEPTSYYGRDSGVGLAIALVNSHPQRIGVIGLGAGTVATYGSPGGTIRYYEINPAIVDIAHEQFSFLKDSQSTIELVHGDARLALEHEAATTGSQKFDVLVVDAFSGDSIPVHLMTREALAVYRKHLQPNGVIAFHVSNRYLNLAPVVAQLAEDAGMQAVHIHHQPDAAITHWLAATDYVLVTNNAAFLADPEIKQRGAAVEPVPGLRVWTDDYNNLFKILR